MGGRITIVPNGLKINTFYRRAEVGLPNENTGAEIAKMGRDAERGLLITIEPHWSNASRGQLGFMWWMCEKIAGAMNKKTPFTKEDIYRHAIRKAGEYQEAIIPNDKLIMRERMWARTHKGNFSEEVSPLPRGGKTKVRQYISAAVYEAEQMRRIIDHLKAEAEKWGIDVTDAARKALLEE